MSYAGCEEPPRKKPRFFVDDAVDDVSTPTTAEKLDALLGPSGTNGARDGVGTPVAESDGAFDEEAFAAIVGEHRLPPSSVRRLGELSGNSLERAVNMYFDGSWQQQGPTRTLQSSSPHSRPTAPPSSETNGHASSAVGNDRTSPVARADVGSSRQSGRADMPAKRYVGAFGVTGWATRSGSNLLAHGETVTIERQKSQPRTKMGRGGKQVALARQRTDVIVRFTNARGHEVGRFESETAAWISTLLDQKSCAFEGSCVFVPDRIRTNDTIYLQLRCYLLRSAFDAGGFVKPADNNRETGFFESKETADERDLRLRQVALVKLFDEINLQPSKVNAATEKHKKQGILKAAESVEEKEKKRAAQVAKGGDGSSTPQSDDAEEGEELEQDQLDSLYKKAQSFDFNTPEAQPAETFAMELRKYQRQALHWMMGKEKDEKSDETRQLMHPLWEEYAWPVKDVDGQDLPEVENLSHFYVNPYSGELSLAFPVQEQNCLGGVLADEMGLGKTIEMLSLIHSHRPAIESGSSADAGSVVNLPRLAAKSSAVEYAPHTTLVVAPMSLLAQWQSETEKASKAGTLKVLVYYGSEKTVNLQQLCCAANVANAPNVIITSYGVVLSEFNQVASMDGNRGSHGGLFSLEYFRVILDEAHFIRNRQSKTAKACYEISATHRWVLTGTPIVNRLEDLFSLVRFLRVEPWSNFSFWKTFITVPFECGEFIRALDVVQTVLEPLVLRRTKDMKTADGESLVPLPAKTIEIDHVELSKDERDVYDHIFQRAKRTFAQNVEAGTLMKSYTTIFAQILRLRQSCCHPVLTRNQSIVADELEAASASDAASGFSDDMDLQTLIRRFQADDDGEQDANVFGANALKQIQSDETAECPICAEEPMVDRAVTGCWHGACKQCLIDYIRHQRDKGETARCFNCREPINSRDVFEVVHHPVLDPDSPRPALFGSRTEPAPLPPGDSHSTTARVSLRRLPGTHQQSAKIVALLSHLRRLRRTQPTAKVVVFSQFTAFLDLIAPALDRDAIPSLRFDGTLTQKARAAVLADFATRKRGAVLLLSLRAGGVGLNLTCASAVFLMDPWWSFAVEAQAIDRVHRMGQTGEVRVVRFVVRGSIEEKMLRIQERKRFIASSLGMMSDEEKKMQRIEDIKELLSE